VSQLSEVQGARPADHTAIALARSWRGQFAARAVSLPLVALGAVCLLGLGLRLWDLGDRSFWTDELSAVGTSALSFRDLLQALTVEANMTLYYWALFVWLRIVGFGASEATIRLLSVAAGCGGIPLIYVLGRRLHSTAAGLAAAGLLAVNSFHVLMSQETRSYALLSTLTILSFILLDRSLETGRKRDWLLHGLVTIAAFYCHFYTVFTVLSQGVFVLSRRSRQALFGLVVSACAMALLAAQLVPFFIRQSNGAKLSHLLRPDFGDLQNFFVGFSGGNRWTLALYLVLALVGLLLAGNRARTTGYRAWLLLSWLVLPVGLSFLVSQVRPIFNDRYLFATLPALPLLAGIGLARLPWPAGVAAGLAVTTLSVYSQQGDFQVRRIEQFREAAAYTSTSARPGDGYIFVSKWGQNGFEYYAGWHWGTNPDAPYADVFEPFDWRVAATVPKYRGVIDMNALPRFASGHPRIWLVLSHEFDAVLNADTAAPVRDWLVRNGYGIAQQRQLKSVRIQFFQRRS
jgi:mannosyltransferase